MDTLKDQTRRFWDLNPCGISDSWQKASELRFKYTDAYLSPHLHGDLFRAKRVLEVGCGQGLDAVELVQTCASYVGIDLSEQSLSTAREALRTATPDGTPTECLLGDAENLSFAGQSFDVVYSVGVLHHTPEFDRAFDEVHRVIANRGTIFLMLYRSYTPLWCVLRVVRGILRTPLIGPGLKRRVLDASRRRQAADTSESGTVIQELFGCPVIDTYTLRGIRKRCLGRSTIVHEECHRVGFEQMIRLAPKFLHPWWPQRLFERMEGVLGRWLGFYMLVIIEKGASELAIPGE